VSDVVLFEKEAFAALAIRILADRHGVQIKDK
jgi:hypothetical protein